jgi:hypothetical protein
MRHLAAESDARVFPALGASFARCFIEQLAMIFRSEVVAQQAHSRQVQSAPFDQAENGCKTSRQPCRGNAMEGLVFAQPKPATAVVEERAATRFEMQAPLFDRREVRDDPRLSARVVRKQPRKLDLQITIGNVSQLPECPAVHESRLARRFSSSASTQLRHFKLVTTSKAIAVVKVRERVSSREHDARIGQSRLAWP